jgi:hypothetical protein
MDFQSANLPETHFLAVPTEKQGLSALDKALSDVYFAIDDRKSVLVIAEKLGLKLNKIRKSLASLWEQGLVVRVEVLDKSYLQHLRQSFAQIVGEEADRTIEEVARRLGLDLSEIPMSRAEEFVGELAGEIPDPREGEKFVGFMLRIVPGLTEFKENYKKSKTKTSTLQTADKKASLQSDTDGRNKGDSGKARSKGKIRELLDRIIARRSKGNLQAAEALKVKFALKGINPEHFSAETMDDPALLQRMVSMAQDYGISTDTDQQVSVGKIKLIIDSIITQRSGGNPQIARAMKTKLVLKGINPDDYSLNMPDNPVILEKVKNLAHSYGVSVGESKSQSIGRIKLILETIIVMKSKGNPKIAMSLKNQFIKKGLDPDRYSYMTPDNPILLKKLETLARSLGVLLQSDSRISKPSNLT